MIALLSAPEILPEGSSWVLLLWSCDPFDPDYSFRVLLDAVSAILRERESVDIDLPPEQPGEDFVDGSLRWGADRFHVYFERSLGYLQFSSPSQEVIRRLLSALASSVTLARRAVPTPA